MQHRQDNSKGENLQKVEEFLFLTWTHVERV